MPDPYENLGRKLSEATIAQLAPAAVAMAWLIGWIVVDRRYRMVGSTVGDANLSVAPLAAAAAATMAVLTLAVIGISMVVGILGSNVPVLRDSGTIFLLWAIVTWLLELPTLVDASLTMGAASAVSLLAFRSSNHIDRSHGRAPSWTNYLCFAMMLAIAAALGPLWMTAQAEDFYRSVDKGDGPSAIPFGFGPPVELVDISSLDLGRNCAVLLHNDQGVFTLSYVNAKDQWRRVRVRLDDFEGHILRPCHYPNG